MRRARPVGAPGPVRLKVTDALGRAIVWRSYRCPWCAAEGWSSRAGRYAHNCATRTWDLIEES